MTPPAQRAAAAFHGAFAEAPTMLIRAPGRVNLIGEHTDYNDGFVLPCAIDRETIVAIGPAPGRLIEVVAADFGGQVDAICLDEPIQRSQHEWANYVRGVIAMLSDQGIDVIPARLAIAGDVPLGAGLSSSASLEIAVARALCEIAGVVVDLTSLAKIAQRAENQFVGAQCGIMDQLIAARAIAGHATLIDCRTLDCRPVAMPADWAIIIAHSGIRHAHASGEYNTRRAQCAAASKHYGVTALRDLTVNMLEAGKAGLDRVAYCRARHVVTENARTADAARALEHGNIALLGQLMRQSHVSMRDDFQITVPAVDRLADIMNEVIGDQGGARMTGGGFGGCIVGITTEAMAPRVWDHVAANYRDPDGNIAQTFTSKAEAGASRV